MAVLLFIQSIMSTPAIFVGLIAMLGLLLQKSDLQTVIKGTIMTILGFIVLNAGAALVQEAIVPFGNIFQMAFGMEGVIPNNEAVVSLGLTQFATETAGIFALGMVANIILARFSNMYRVVSANPEYRAEKSAGAGVVFSHKYFQHR